jgi:hypothetical protein
VNLTHIKFQAMNIDMQNEQAHQPRLLRPVGSLWQAAMAWLAGVAITSIVLLKPLPALALAFHDAPWIQPYGNHVLRGRHA